MLRFQWLTLFCACVSTALAQSCQQSQINQDLSNGFIVTYAPDCSYKTVQNAVNGQSYVVFNTTRPNISSNSTFINTAVISSIGLRNANVAYAYLEMLGLDNQIIYSDDLSTITSNCTSSLLSSNSTPSIVFSTSTDAFAGANSSVPVVTIPLNQDTRTPIQDASLLMYLSYFFNLESTAYSAYEVNIKGIYQCNKENLQNAGAKTIAVTNYINNAWNLETNTTYFSTLIKDAGMTPFTGALSSLHEANFVLDVSSPQMFPNGFTDWLSALQQFDSQINVFNLQKNVYKTDRLVNSLGYPDSVNRGPARPDLMLQDVIHMVYPTYNSAYQWTWIRNYAKGDSSVQTKSNYPSCNAVNQFTQCPSGAFTPGGSTSPDTSAGAGGLSTGAKVGIAVGVIVGVVGIAVAGIFLYRRKKHQVDPPRTFYKMQDLQ